MTGFFCNGKKDFCAVAEIPNACMDCEFADGSGGSMRELPENPYWDNICKMASKQRKKGIETYGQGLESNPADIITRLEYLQEELIDGLMYIEWAKDYIRKDGQK